METPRPYNKNRSWIYAKTVAFLLCLSAFSSVLLFTSSLVFPWLTVPVVSFSLSVVSQMRSFLATLILLFPLMALLLFSLRRDFRKDEGVFDSSLYKFLYYLFLGLPVFLIVGFSISFVSSLLGGTVDMFQLINLGATILVFAPGIFFVSIVIHKGVVSPLNLLLLLTSYLLISVAVFSLAFIKVGPPGLERVVSNEANKITALEQLTEGIQDFFYQFGKLPNSLEELKSIYPDRNFFASGLSDYNYSQGGEESYKLCTTFKMTSEELRKYGYNFSEKFQHPKGTACFDFSVSTTFCRTLNTKMVVGLDNRGQIGCDIEVNGRIDLSKSYCEGQKTHNKEYLVMDAFGRPNRYFATLTGLDMDEEVRVFAYTWSGTELECLPSLNK